MPEEVKRTNKAAKPEPPQVTEIEWQGAAMWLCPVCAATWEDKALAEEHLGLAHPGGEE